MANFIYDKVKINNLTFTFDGNSKITASNGTYSNPSCNSFSIHRVKDCPGSTKSCKQSCYVLGIKKNVNELYNLYSDNSDNIRKYFGDSKYDYDINNLIDKFSTWINNNCHGKEFRWHVSGDVFNLEYAKFITSVCKNSPSVRFWIYTRSFIFTTDHNTEYADESIVRHLTTAGNLVVNISADKDNYHIALPIANKYSLRICYFVSDHDLIPADLPEGSVIFPDYNLRGRDMERPEDHPWWKQLSEKQKNMVCVVDFFGQSNLNRCGVCTKCLKFYHKR